MLLPSTICGIGVCNSQLKVSLRCSPSLSETCTSSSNTSEEIIVGKSEGPVFKGGLLLLSNCRLLCVANCSLSLLWVFALVFLLADGNSGKTYTVRIRPTLLYTHVVWVLYNCCRRRYFVCRSFHVYGTGLRSRYSLAASLICSCISSSLPLSSRFSNTAPYDSHTVFNWTNISCLYDRLLCLFRSMLLLYILLLIFSASIILLYRSELCILSRCLLTLGFYLGWFGKGTKYWACFDLLNLFSPAIYISIIHIWVGACVYWLLSEVWILLRRWSSHMT